MLHVRWLLPQLVVSVICGRVALLWFEVTFIYGEGGQDPPLGWKFALYCIIATVVLSGVGLAYIQSRFPWPVLFMIPVMIRVSLLRLLQADLYSLASILGAYTDLVFLLGAVIGVLAFRNRQRKTVA